MPEQVYRCVTHTVRNETENNHRDEQLPNGLTSTKSNSARDCERNQGQVRGMTHGIARPRAQTADLAAHNERERDREYKKLSKHTLWLPGLPAQRSGPFEQQNRDNRENAGDGPN
jgi:hypothetical protein